MPVQSIESSVNEAVDMKRVESLDGDENPQAPVKG
jgi:hypothetical protein